MALEIKGKVLQVFPVVTGTGKKGQWSKQSFLLETPGQFPKKLEMSIWGQEKIDKYDLEPGLVVTASIELESREHQGRWYTEVRAWKLSWESDQKRKWQPGGGETQSTDWP